MWSDSELESFINCLNAVKCYSVCTQKACFTTKEI